MEATLRKYAERIERGEVQAHVRHDGVSSGLIFDPSRDDTPLMLLGFGVLRLGRKDIVHETGEREMVLVPQDGAFEADVDGTRFSGGRSGGPLAPGPGRTNASALYVPRDSVLRIRGTGEAAFFEAPALGKKPPFHREQAEVFSRGEWVWRRDIVNLVSPKDASTRLIVGETLSPPGFWSGTPLHVHDRDARPAESDFEEVYYHRLGPRTPAGSQFDAYGVQLLFDGKRMMKSYVVGDRSAIAIPGGAHPVAASPVCAHLYLWGLAGSGTELIMKDLPEFAHLKSFEDVFRAVRSRSSSAGPLSRAELDELCARHGLGSDQAALLRIMLAEQGVTAG